MESGLFPDRIAQRTTKSIKPHLRHVSVFKNDAFSKRECIRSEEVNVHATRLPVSCEFEVMMFQIRQAVAHILFATGYLALPQDLFPAHDPRSEERRVGKEC